MDRRSALKLLSLSAASAALPAGCRQEPPGVPPSFAFNQVGYLPADRKVATLPASAASAAFSLQSASTGKTVFQAAAGPALHDALSGDRVALADFSAFTHPGSYRLVTAAGRSAPFAIDAAVYRDTLRTAMRGYYGQRCGCAVDLGGGYRHPPCHLDGAFHPTSGRGGQVPNHGGWHDAGDYGRYVVNGGLTLGTLLWAWELYPRPLQNLSLAIPESGGKIPDYLAEIRWNLQWMLSLQDADGGVWHKQTSERFAPFVMPQDDHLVSYIIGTGSSPWKSTCATADLAAVAAIAARCYGPYDDAFARQCLAASRSAWLWAVAHPGVMFRNPRGISTGEYGDSSGADEILWASAELWRTTGDPQYRDAFFAGTKSLSIDENLWTPSWPEVASMAYWTTALSDRPGSEILRGPVLDRTAYDAQFLISRTPLSGYGTTLAACDYIWGSNAVAANQFLLLLIANHFHNAPDNFPTALANLHYLLGRNCFAVSWLTQVGSNPFQHPHHRPSVADGIAAPWPGLLSGGPNAHPADYVARDLPRRPPMRMWIDNDGAYSVNEICLNWNAPLVFLLAAANAA